MSHARSKGLRAAISEAEKVKIHSNGNLLRWKMSHDWFVLLGNGLGDASDYDYGRDKDANKNGK
jgi:hypothetical protein